MELRLSVKAYIEMDGQVLLVKEDGGEYSSFSTLPGGGVHEGERLESALQRELQEEIGVHAEVGEYLGMCTYEHRSMPRKSAYLIFRCSIDDLPEPQESEGIQSIKWASPDALPDDCFECIQQSITSISERLNTAEYQ